MEAADDQDVLLASSSSLHSTVRCCSCPPYCRTIKVSSAETTITYIHTSCRDRRAASSNMLITYIQGHREVLILLVRANARTLVTKKPGDSQTGFPLSDAVEQLMNTTSERNNPMSVQCGKPSHDNNTNQ